MAANASPYLAIGSVPSSTRLTVLDFGSPSLASSKLPAHPPRSEVAMAAALWLLGFDFGF